MKIVAIINQKGGVGKTNLVCHSAWYFAQQGKSVLVVDLDPQGHATMTLGGGDCASIMLFAREPVLDPTEVYRDTNGGRIDLVGADISLAKAVNDVRFDSYGRLRRLLKPRTAEWDYVFVDCPPSLGDGAYGMFSINALIAAQHILVPVLPTYFSLHALEQIVQTVERVRESGLNPAVRLTGIVINHYDRSVPCREAREVIDENLPGKLFSTGIPRAVGVERAMQLSTPVWDLDPGSSASFAFMKILKEFGERMDLVPGAEEVFFDTSAAI